MFLAACIAGVVVGYATGGRLRCLADVPLRALAVPWLAVIGQLSLPLLPLRFPLVAATAAAAAGAAVWMLREARSIRVRASLGTIVVGAALNLLPTLANDGMPVSSSALRAAGVNADPTKLGIAKHVVAGPHTHLAFLGDVIGVRAWHAAISVGDIVLLCGIAAFLAAAMRPLDERRRVFDDVARVLDVDDGAEHYLGGVTALRPTDAT